MELSLMKLNDHKAGMQGLDIEKINQIIKEASKGSKFYRHKIKSQERVNAKVAELQSRLANFTEEQLILSKKKMDRLASQLELERDLSQTIVHVDMDAFYAAVEMRDNPELLNKPMAVGSLGMLSTSNYIARRFGVRAAMPGFIGRKLCPELVIVAPNFEKYTAVSKEIQAIFSEYDPNFSAMSLDEAYLNITSCLETAQLSSPDASAWEIVEEMRHKVFEKTQLTASAGIAANTMLAKVCSDKNKPNGQYFLPNDLTSIRDFVAELPIRKVSGIGNVTEQLLGSLGIKTCQDLWLKRDVLGLLFSENSYEHFLRIALGLGATELGGWTERDRKSISNETTFAAQSDPVQLLKICSELSEELATDLKRKGLLGKSVTLKLKTDSFDVKTRVHNLMDYTSDPKLIENAAHQILQAEIHSHKPATLTLRLLGVRMSNLCSEQAAAGGSSKRQKTLKEMLNQAKRTKLPTETLPSFHGNEDLNSDVDFGPQEYCCPVCQSITADNLELFNNHLDQCLGLVASENGDVVEAEVGTTSNSSFPTELDEKNPSVLSAPCYSRMVCCPVCGNWQTCLGEDDLNKHLDECLNEPLIKKWQEAELQEPQLSMPSTTITTKNMKIPSTHSTTQSRTSSSLQKKKQGNISSSSSKQVKLDGYMSRKA